MSVEGAIAISVLVAAFASLMAIVQESYATDRMGRAARAVAHAVALDAQADHCAAIRRELGLAADFDCGSEWQITVDVGVSPSDLSTMLAGGTVSGTANGELILVRIGWKPEPVGANSVSGSGSGSASSEDTQTNATPVPMVAMGVARSELESG